MLSASNWAVPLTWGDGNDFHDFSASDVLFVQANGFIPEWPYLGPSGYVDTDVAANSIRVLVSGGHSVTPSASIGGRISPPSVQQVATGDTVTFEVVPDFGYELDDFGGTCPAGVVSGNSYSTGAITSDCTVVANFTAATATILNVPQNATRDSPTRINLEPGTYEVIPRFASLGDEVLYDTNYRGGEYLWNVLVQGDGIVSDESTNDAGTAEAPNK